MTILDVHFIHLLYNILHFQGASTPIHDKSQMIPLEVVSDNIYEADLDTIRKACSFVKKNHPDLFADECFNDKVDRPVAISHCITAALLKKSNENLSKAAKSHSR